jgi:putative transposase
MSWMWHWCNYSAAQGSSASLSLRTVSCPTHLHVLVSGESDGSDFARFVKRFKQLSGYNYSRNHQHAKLWQPGYHERVLRHDEATIAVVRYILANPVRAGLAPDTSSYPFSGSELYSRAVLESAFDDSRQA